MAPTFVLMLLAILAVPLSLTLSDAILAAGSVLLGITGSKDEASEQRGAAGPPAAVFIELFIRPAAFRRAEPAKAGHVLPGSRYRVPVETCRAGTFRLPSRPSEPGAAPVRAGSAACAGRPLHLAIGPAAPVRPSGLRRQRPGRSRMRRDAPLAPYKRLQDRRASGSPAASPGRTASSPRRAGSTGAAPQTAGARRHSSRS